MSGNVALRNRRRREHAAYTGGRSKSSPVVTVDATVPLPRPQAEEKAAAAVRDVTGVALEDGSGSIVLGTFSELFVEMGVEERGSESRVHVALRTGPRNTGLAILMLALLVLSIVGIVIYALRLRGKKDERAKLKAMARQLEAAILSSR